MKTLQWREFEDLPDVTVRVTTWETPVGKTCKPINSKYLGTIIVSRDMAISMLREGTG